MPRTKEANAFLKEQRKQQILKISLHLFCLYGFNNITTDDIAKEAKISHGLLYHYFSNKTEILKALLIEAKSSLNSLFDIDKINDLEGEDFYRKTTEFLIGALSMGPEFSFYVTLFIQFKFNTEIINSYDNVSYYKKLEKEFLKAQNEGIFQNGNPKEYIACYFYLIKSISYEVIHNKKNTTIPQPNAIMNIFLK